MKTGPVLDIEYRVSPRRKSIGIQVTSKGQVVITLPRGASKADLNRALEKHRAWMERQVAARQAALRRLKEGEAYFLGQPFQLKARRGAAEAVTLTGKEIRVPRSEAGEGVLWPRLQAWYREQALDFLTARVRHWGGRLGLAPGPVELREWKRRWGECHPDGKLRFNWRLIMCPLEIIDYVVVHELSHLKVPGHSRRFWAQVAKALPDYAQRRRWLNRDGAPFLWWRPEA